MQPKLHNKVVVITGSTRGLGRAVAAACRREGAKVVISARTRADVDATVGELGGGDVLGVVCDVSDLSQVRQLAERATDHFGAIDVWMNNAAVTAAYGRTMDVAVEDYRQVVQVNVLGTYYGSRVALQHMLPRGSGKLINLSGRGARRPVPYQNSYAPTKAWVVNFTRALAQEYAGRGVDVMVFSPGMVLTDLLTNVQVIGPDMERRFKRFPRILRMFAYPPQVPAEMAVEVMVSGENGKSYEFLTRQRMIRGMFAEFRRGLTRRSDPLPEVHIRVKEPDSR